MSGILTNARNKILKPATYTPSDVESAVAQALFELQINNGTEPLKIELADLHFLAAREITVSAQKKAIVVFVPFVELKAYRKVHARLVRELEKKFSGKHVIIIAQRRIIKKPLRDNKIKQQKRPFSRTKTAVHQAILEDICFPSAITGQRLRYRLDGSKQLKVHLDKKDQQSVEAKLDTFHVVYKKLTGNDAAFLFPVLAD
jgi:small subunit ribosomal protein S7e